MADEGEPQEPEPTPWAARIKAATAHGPTVLQAFTFLRRLERSFTNPVVMECSDGQEYVVKATNIGRRMINGHIVHGFIDPKIRRSLINDQVVGRLGAAMNAPTGTVALIDVPSELIDAEAEMDHMTPGLAHGCLYIKNTTDREAIGHIDAADNPTRFARLAILYGWIGSNDDQFIYSTVPPPLVYSVDHGNFFPGGPAWTAAGLRSAPTPAANANLVNQCMINDKALRDACRLLKAIDNATIAAAVAAPPDQWDFPDSDRVALAEYLAQRRDALAQAY